jgi:hypothetical protein
MANTSVVYLDTDLVGLWWCYFHILNRKVLAGLPGDGGLHKSQMLTELTGSFRIRTLQVMVYWRSHCQCQLGHCCSAETYLSNGIGRHLDELSLRYRMVNRGAERGETGQRIKNYRTRRDGHMSFSFCCRSGVVVYEGTVGTIRGQLEVGRIFMGAITYS